MDSAPPCASFQVQTQPQRLEATAHTQTNENQCAVACIVSSMNGQVPMELVMGDNHRPWQGEGAAPQDGGEGPSNAVALCKENGGKKKKKSPSKERVKPENHIHKGCKRQGEWELTPRGRPLREHVNDFKDDGLYVDADDRVRCKVCKNKIIHPFKGNRFDISKTRRHVDSRRHVKLATGNVADYRTHHGGGGAHRQSTVPQLFRFGQKPSLEDIRKMQATYSEDRDWDQFHSPRNLLLALVGEVGQLSEIFQWKSDAQCRNILDWSERDRKHLGHELSDVLLYLVRLADKCHIDLSAAVNEKIQYNKMKYPVGGRPMTVYDTDEDDESESSESDIIIRAS